MAASTGIGLDIGEDQIRAVKLRRTSRGLYLQALGEVPTPPGAVSGGSLLDPRLVADTVRRVLKNYNIKGAAAVVGLPGRAAASRVLELPHMKEEELRSIVAGEMEHYHTIPPGQGTFDFVSLGETSEGTYGQVRLLLMAADKNVVDTYREVLRFAGLRMSALEPVSLAASRAAFASLAEGAVALVAIGARSTELAVFHNATLRYSRQIDTGALDLVAKQESGILDLGQEAERPLPEEQAAPELKAVGRELQSLLFEIQRSLDFYHREARGAGRVERLVLCVDGERLRGLDRFLERDLGLPVSLCEPFRSIYYSDVQFNPEYLARVGPAFAPAVGLALRELEEVPQAPRMDLSVTGLESVLAKAAPRWLTWALGISIFLVISAVAAFWQLGRVLQARQQELTTAKAELVRVSRIEEEYTLAARRAQEAQAIVQLRGLPWSDILFQVSEFIPKGVWLTNLTTDAGNLLSLEGGALSADSVATLMDSLTHSALFEAPRMTFIQKDTSGRQMVVKFQIKVLVRPPIPVSSQPATGNLSPPGGAR